MPQAIKCIKQDWLKKRRIKYVQEELINKRGNKVLYYTRRDRVKKVGMKTEQGGRGMKGVKGGRARRR